MQNAQLGPNPRKNLRNKLVEYLFLKEKDLHINKMEVRNNSSSITLIDLEMFQNMLYTRDDFSNTPS